MDHLESISMDDLQRALGNVERKKPAQRLITAIAYKNGLTQTELAEWYDVERRTIYSWLKRLDTDGPIEAAVTDASRPGRTRKLSESQQKEFKRTVNDPPANAGFDASAWTTALVQQYLEESYGVSYSRPSCRRLLKEAGLSYKNPHGNIERTDRNSRDKPSEGMGTVRGKWTPQ